ncbi:MAG: ABATE domain-containing protein [Anaerolineales bacterium]|nr:ABATE domain-containing protein [Anaerolineales bacterium]
MALIYAAENERSLRTGRLCLDFANTASWHAAPHPDENINGYADLLAWARRVGLVGVTEAVRLTARARRQPGAAQAVYRRAIDLREAIFRTLSAHATAQTLPDLADMDTLNAELTTALAHARLQRTGGRYHLVWELDGEALDGLLWPIAYSAADLLATPQLLERVGRCADDRGCGWLFLDMTKNRSRRWCDMQDCGNRAKARRHYARQRARALG